MTAKRKIQPTEQPEFKAGDEVIVRYANGYSWYYKVIAVATGPWDRDSMSENETFVYISSETPWVAIRLINSEKKITKYNPNNKFHQKYKAQRDQTKSFGSFKLNKAIESLQNDSKRKIISLMECWEY